MPPDPTPRRPKNAATPAISPNCSEENTQPATVPVPTPILAANTIFITSAHGRYAPIYAIEAGARGEVTNDAETNEGQTGTKTMTFTVTRTD